MEFQVSKVETIKEIVKANLCTGCGTCVAICSFLAIEMVKNDSNGTYIPRLDEQKCKKCGICYLVCPGCSLNLKELNQDIFYREPSDILFGNYLNCYVGYSMDHDIRYNSSSGGLATSVLTYALEQGIIDGALVTRMKKDNPLEPEPFIARTKDEIIEASKSKYCPVPANIALREILKQEGKYAVVGLPCHINGIRKAEVVNKELKKRVVLHLSIFCSGTPNFRATEFLLYRLNLRIEEIKKIEYRGLGWPGNMSLYLKNDKVKVIPYPRYWNGFGYLFFPCSRCTKCIDWFSMLADISIGDAWLPDIKRNDNIGTSTIISRTPQGEDILSQMLRKEIIMLNFIDSDMVYKSQPGFHRKKRQLMTRFTISRSFFKKVPAIDYDILPEPLLTDYLKCFLLYLQSVLASRYELWWLLSILTSFIRFGSILKAKLRL